MNYLEQAKEIISFIELGYEIMIDETISASKQEYLREHEEDFEVILDRIIEGALSGFIKKSPFSLDDFADKEDFYDQITTDFCNHKAKTKKDCEQNILVKLKYI